MRRKINQFSAVGSSIYILTCFLHMTYAPKTAHRSSVFSQITVPFQECSQWLAKLFKQTACVAFIVLFIKVLKMDKGN